MSDAGGDGAAPAQPPPQDSPHPHKKRNRVLSVLRWTVAVVGITWVLFQLHLRDRALAILNPETNIPVEVILDSHVPETAPIFPIRDPDTGRVLEISQERIVNRPDKDQVAIVNDGGQKQTVELLGLHLSDDLRIVHEFLIKDPQTSKGRWVQPDRVPDYKLDVPYPRNEVGLISIVREADLLLLLAAVFVYPVTFVLCSYRWHELLKALDIRIGQGRAFVLNMVGLFYNTFMPGSTGGDLLKAYYVSKHTTKYRTRAVLSVLIDRIIGLLALVIIGGTMAATQLDNPDCRYVAIGAAVILSGTILGLIVFYTRALRKFTGLEYILGKLPMQAQVQKAVEAMEILGKRPFLVLWALIVTFPVHMSVVVSMIFAGMAFGLQMHWVYYWVVFPVVVLAGAMPISPQGAGVMEVFAIALMRPHGVTVSQALAMTVALRVINIFWNLTGGVFVMRGGYHAPTDKEQEEMENESPVTTLPPEAVNV